LDLEVAGVLRVYGFDDPLAWAGALAGEEVAADKAQLRQMFDAFNLLEVDDQEAADRLDLGLDLAAAARVAARSWQVATAQIPNEQLSLDAVQAAKRTRVEKVEADLAKLATKEVLAAPALWRGKVYRRLEQAGDPNARQKAEKQEREKWGRKVVGLLVEAGLPFGREVQSKDFEHGSPEAFRCLRGLRASTLRKRSQDWAPCRRFLLAHEGRPFPAEAREVLAYFQARQEGQASRTSYSSLLLALAFLEDSGEQPKELRLAGLSSLTNAAKEAATQRALLGATTTTGLGGSAGG